MSYNEIFVPPGVFAMSTPGWWPWSPWCAENWPWRRSSYRRRGRVPSPLLVPGDPSAFAAPAAGLNVEPAFVHSWLRTGTWICEPRDGTDWTEALYEWVWQLPNEICSGSKPILCKEVPPVVVGGRFPNHSSDSTAEDIFPIIAVTPWHLPSSFAVVGSSSKQPEQWKAGMPGSGF